jgi:hypothetical protein
MDAIAGGKIVLTRKRVLYRRVELTETIPG